MKDPSPDQLQGYRSAIALNNMGVYLIESHDYHGAMCVLKDSVNAWKGVFRRSGPSAENQTSTGPNRNSHAALLEKKMQKASRRCAKPHPPIRHPTVIETIAYEDSVIPLLCLNELSSAVSCLRPTRIDPPESCDYCAFERDPDLETVIVLCNFAISYFLISKTVDDGTCVAKLVSNALSVLNLASHVLTRRFAVCDDDVEEVRLMTVSLLVTGNLMQVLLETGRVEEARKLYEKYQNIREAIEECDVVEWFGNEVKIAAGAA